MSSASAFNFSPGRKKSVMWLLFDQLKADRTKAKCKVCKATLKMNAVCSTTYLHDHMRSVHPHIYENAMTLGSKTNVSKLIKMRFQEKSRRLNLKAGRERPVAVCAPKGQKVDPDFRSDVWKYFLKVQPQQASCTLCGKLLHYSYKLATSRVFKHLKSRHHSFYLEVVARKKSRLVSNHDAVNQDELNSQESLSPGIKKELGELMDNGCLESDITSISGSHADFLAAPILNNRDELNSQESLSPGINKELGEPMDNGCLESDMTSISGSHADSLAAPLLNEKKKHFVSAQERKNRRVKGKKKPSLAWQYFVKLGQSRVKCNLCLAILKFYGCTTNLFCHLKVKHKEHYFGTQQKTQPRLNTKSKQDKLIFPLSPSSEEVSESPELKVNTANHAESSSNATSDGDSVVPANMNLAPATPSHSEMSDKAKNKVNESLIKLISVNLLPPSIVEVREFKEMLKALDSRYELPTKRVLKTLIPDFAEEVKKKLKADVDSASHFALTVETWTYRHGQRCVTVMAHFIKDSWELSAACLETLDCPYSSEGLTQEMKRITDSWGIRDKVVALVSEDLETLSSTALTMGWEHLFCFGNELNSIILSALESVPEVTRILKKFNQVAECFDKSIEASEILLSIQQYHNLPKQKLKSEKENKWISIYRMVERMSEQFEAANTVLTNYGKGDMCLFDKEVQLMRSVNKILQPFMVTVTELLHNEYAYLSKVIPFRNLLLEVLVNSVDDTGLAIPAHAAYFRSFLIQQMDTTFGNIEWNSPLALSTLLDPRFKQLAFTDTAAMETAQDQLLQEMKSIAGAPTEDSVFQNEDIVKENCSSVLSTWTSFHKRVAESEAGVTKSVPSDIENESCRYFKKALIQHSHDPLEWWRLNQFQFPHLHVLAKKYLCIPATSVCSSRLFTKKGEKFNNLRKVTKPNNLNTMVCLSANANYVDKSERDV